MRGAAFPAPIPVLLLALTVTATAGAAGRRESAVPFEARLQSMSWQEIAAEARGQTVYWYMWGGSELVNRFVNGTVARRLKEEHGITLQAVPVTDATTFVNKVLGEKQAGRTAGGSVDLMWINGENFRTMREADLLFGPYAGRLPNLAYVDTSDPSVANDFGFPVEGYESPYGSAQMVMIYDSVRVPEPPRTVDGLLDWIRTHPGKFTYPALPTSPARRSSGTSSTTWLEDTASCWGGSTRDGSTASRLGSGTC